ncbi:hypothetical protein LSAT2_009911 [Lamellibrachia satsuma]|nr:hypothetical protein LSAT2_009911 [Lamellibrachia satsuma]
MARHSTQHTLAFLTIVVFTDMNLYRITECLSNIYFKFALLLNVTRPYVSQVEFNFRSNLWCLNFEVLTKWRDNCDELREVDVMTDLTETLSLLQLNDVASVQTADCLGNVYFKLALRLHVTYVRQL